VVLDKSQTTVGSTQFRELDAGFYLKQLLEINSAARPDHVDQHLRDRH